MEQIVRKNKVYEIHAKDVDTERGIVTVAVNGIGIEDAQGDISCEGSFKKTLAEGMKRMKWLYNHDTHCDIGVPIKGEERDGNLFMTGKLYDTQLSREILNKYKVNAEFGKTLEHSIGVQAIKRDPADKRRVLEWRMYEYSTLSFLGANPDTYLVALKEASPKQVQDAIAYIAALMKQKGFSDETLKSYEDNMSTLLKALEGGRIVTCENCGFQFDYDQQPEHTWGDEVIEVARAYMVWITEDAVRREMDKLRPEIAEGVADLVAAAKGTEGELTEKSITDIASFVRCPHCRARVYKINKLMRDEGVEPSTDTQQESPAEHPAEKAVHAESDCNTFYKSLTESLTINQRN